MPQYTDGPSNIELRIEEVCDTSEQMNDLENDPADITRINSNPKIELEATNESKEEEEK